MRFIFNIVTLVAVKFRYPTLALVIALLVLGGIAATELNQELLPPVEFPQTVVLAQVSGMSSEQVLAVLTQRLEPELRQVENVVNLESQSTGSFGAVLTVFNDFGIDQESLRDDLRAAIDRVWLPQRRILPPDGADAEVFASGLLADLPPEIIVFLADDDSNFLFQLEPEVWNALSDETLRAAVAFLAAQTEDDSDESSALERLVEKEIIPQLDAIDVVASVQLTGGQVLPDDEDADRLGGQAVGAQPDSLLLRISPDVWNVIAGRLPDVHTLDEATIERLSAQALPIPESDADDEDREVEPPILPSSWQFDGFKDGNDLVELASLTTSVATIFNDFLETGTIEGALGQTDDLTPETVARMLEIEPTLAEYFEAEHLVAMAPDVLQVVLDNSLDNLDGFIRDELAADSLAENLTGEVIERAPADLPSPWIIQKPDLIFFSFSDFPLATFSVASTAAPLDSTDTSTADSTAGDSDEAQGEDEEENVDLVGDFPEGPPLPQMFAVMGDLFGAEINTADDLLRIEVSEDLEEFLEDEVIRAADFFNLLTQFSNFDIGTGDGDEDSGLPAEITDLDIRDFIPALRECNIGLLSITSGEADFGGEIIECLSPEAIGFIAANDPDFIDDLDDRAFEFFQDGAFAFEGISPRLPDEWDVLSDQPQFEDRPLETADDLIVLGNGRPSQVLNLINEQVPDDFAGYEVRLFDSLTPKMVRYFVTQEPGFYNNISPDVLLKFSADVLGNIPAEVMASFSPDVATAAEVIAEGDQVSAFDVLSDLYTTDLPPEDPDAPALNEGWQFLESFYNIELDTADDFFRFPQGYQYANASELINSVFESPQGASFGESLLENTPMDAYEYIVDRDGTALVDLIPEALRFMPEDALALLPEDVQKRAEEGGAQFEPTRALTRTNGQPSLFLNVFKTREANTVSAFAAVEELLFELDAQDDSVEVGIIFEQSSFIEESIEGVAREGSLGAVFAVIIILLFLSGGSWQMRPRRITGIVLVVVFTTLFIGLLAIGLGTAEGNWVLAFHQADTVLRVLLLVGIAAGLYFLLWPGNVADPAWRATIVIGVSIPLSVMMAFAMMHWGAPAVYRLLEPYAESSSVASFMILLFPEEMTLNIMTLSGLTVAVGRVVDDSIVVLENIFRQLQQGGDKKEVILFATRDVAAAIFVATLIGVIVFLPLGLTGGIIGAFFLPFGLAVTYALAGSFIVAITVVPVLSYLFIDENDIPDEEDLWLADFYLPILRWALSTPATRFTVLAVSILTMVFGLFLFSQRPFAFLPNFGEPQVTVSIELASGTGMLETNRLVEEMEAFINEDLPADKVTNIQTTVGSAAGFSFEALFGGGGITESQANLTIGLDVNQEELDQLAGTIRIEAERIFGGPEAVTVSGGSAADEGFGGFSLVVSGPQDVIAEFDPLITETLEGIDGITNVTSNLTQNGNEADDGPITYIRVNEESAISYSAELETNDTIGVTTQAIDTIKQLPELPDNILVRQGFNSEIQTQGFNSLPQAMGIAVVIVVFILILSFRSLVYWLALILSIVVAPVGAAVALTITDRVLGISALIGLLMLLGLVVTNAVVLIDRVITNRTERHMELYDSLIEAGGRRLRPILMTSLATIIALIPLAVGLSEGAIIAAELGTVVIGGVVSSTLLTLIVVPVAFSLLQPIHQRITEVFNGRKSE